MNLNTLGHGILGMQRGISMVNRAAAQTAAQEGPAVEPVKDMMIGQRSFEANTASVKTTDEMLLELMNMRR